MGQNSKKTLIEPLVNWANQGNTSARRKLRAWLRTIVRFKDEEIPPKILVELERVNRRRHFLWTSLKDETLVPATEDDLAQLENMANVFGPPNSLLKEILELEKRMPEKFARIWGTKDRAVQRHLGSYGFASEFDYYLWLLMEKLRDPDWVAALTECPKCKRLLLNFYKWENRYCDNPECKKYRKTISARKSRKRIKCPGLKGFGNDEMTLSDCKQTQKDDPFPECPSCPNSKKKGGRHGSNSKAKNKR